MHVGREPRPSRIPRGRADVVGPEPEQELRAGRQVGEGSRPGPPRDVRERRGDGCTVTPLRLREVHLRRAYHLSDVRVHRVFVELVRGARLNDAPVAEHPDALAHPERLQLVRRRVEHRRAELPVQPLELRAHVVAELGVEVGQRFVEEQQARAADEGAADRDPLLLASARGFGLAVEDVPDAEHFRHLAHPGPDLGPRDAGLAEGIGEVLEDGEVRIEGEGLEHHRDPAIGRRDARDVLAVEFHPPAVRRLEPGDDPQGRGLAGRARPEQAEELPVPDAEVDAVQGDHRPEAFAHAFKAKVNVRLRARAGFGGGGRAQGPCPIVPEVFVPPKCQRTIGARSTRRSRPSCLSARRTNEPLGSAGLPPAERSLRRVRGRALAWTRPGLPSRPKRDGSRTHRHRGKLRVSVPRPSQGFCARPWRATAVRPAAGPAGGSSGGAPGTPPR